MNDANPIQVLDDFLGVFIKHKHEGYKVSISNLKDLQDWDKVADYEIIMVLDKLMEDGYVQLIIRDEPYKTVVESVTAKRYKLSFNGKIFTGYVKSYEDAENENRIRKKKDNLLTWGTWLAGIGSLSLVLWEMYKHYFLHID